MKVEIESIGYEHTQAPTIFTWGLKEDVAMSDVRVGRVPINLLNEEVLEVTVGPYSMNVVEL